MFTKPTRPASPSVSPKRRRRSRTKPCDLDFLDPESRTFQRQIAADCDWLAAPEELDQLLNEKELDSYAQMKQGE